MLVSEDNLAAEVKLHTRDKHPLQECGPFRGILCSVETRWVESQFNKKLQPFQKKLQTAEVKAAFKSSLPIDDEHLEGGGLVTHGASPRGLLLVHLQEKDRVETLKVGTGQNSTRDTETHLHQLGDGEGDRESELNGRLRDQVNEL